MSTPKTYQFDSSNYTNTVFERSFRSDWRGRNWFPPRSDPVGAGNASIISSH